MVVLYSVNYNKNCKRSVSIFTAESHLTPVLEAINELRKGMSSCKEVIHLVLKILQVVLHCTLCNEKVGTTSILSLQNSWDDSAPLTCKSSGYTPGSCKIGL